MSIEKPTTSKALFLDRDGVINIDYGHVFKKENFDFVEGIFSLCKKAVELDYRLFVITNQAGIGKGYYSLEEYEELTTWMITKFDEKNISLDKVYYCPYHAEAKIVKYRKKHHLRKPNPGMILLAKEEFDLDLSRSILIGDKVSDIEAGNRGGVNLNFLYGNSEGEFKKLNCIQISSLSEVIPYL